MRTLGLLVLGAALLLAGCSGYYGSDRARDAADIWTVSGGRGLGVKARVGPLAPGLTAGNDGAGLRGGEFFSVPVEGEFAPCQDQLFLLGGYELFQTGHDTGDLRGKHFRARNRFVFQLPMREAGEGEGRIELPPTGWEYYAQAELQLGLYGSLRLGLNAVEALDFLLGLAGLDLLRDDLGPLRGNLKWSGRLVDAAGEPVEGARLRLRVMRARGFDDGWSSESLALEPDFERLFPNCHRVALAIEHPHYRRVTRAWDLTRPDATMRRVGGRGFEVRERIVLQKTEARLVAEAREARREAERRRQALRRERPRSYNVKLEWHPERGASVWDLSAPGEPRRDDWEPLRSEARPEGAGYPRLYCRALEGEGVELVLEGAEGGLLPIPSAAGMDPRVLAAQLDELPAEGYGRRWRFEAGEAAERQYFYLRRGALYGWGELFDLKRDEDGALRLALRLHLLPEGRRRPAPGEAGP